MKGLVSVLGRRYVAQFTLGEKIKDGEKVFVKMTSDGTQISRKDNATIT